MKRASRSQADQVYVWGLFGAPRRSEGVLRGSGSAEKRVVRFHVIFKRFLYVLISLISLLIAFMFSVFIMILFNINLNFANMIALPLLYSLGISFTIYFIKRFIQYEGKIDSVISSNTPKAIIFSAATTMVSISTLAISSHSGTSSMGLLLFICLLMTVLSAVFILPVLLSSFKFLIK